MSTFYTRSGDDGTTGRLGEGRIAKNDPTLEALGALDESTAALGLARAICTAPETPELLLQVQRHLYGLMAEVSATPETAARFRSIGSTQVEWLEAATARLESLAPPPKEFIVPGDTYPGAQIDLARTIVRRAERRLMDIVQAGLIANPDLLRYLNRLSSFLFVLEIYENQAGGKAKPTFAKTR